MRQYWIAPCKRYSRLKHTPTTPMPPGPRPEAKEISIDQIERDPDQPRRNDGLDIDQNRLYSSIEQLGIQQPIAVTEQGTGKYRIMDGHRRYKCAQKLNFPTIPCLVYPPLNHGDREYLRFELQNNRRSWTPIERAQSIQNIRKGKKVRTDRELAKLLRISKTVISNSFNLLQLNIEYLDLMLRYGLTNSYQFEFVRLKQKLQKIKELEINEIVEILLQKFRDRTIRGAKGFRKVGTAFLRAKTNEDLLHQFLTSPTMTSDELEQLMDRAGYLVAGEKLMQQLAEKMSKGHEFPPQEKQFFLKLINLLTEAAK